MTLRVCPTLHRPPNIDAGFFASPVPLPLTRTLEACLGRFNDPKRTGYNPNYRWGDDDDKVGHKGLDLGAKTGAPVTAMADGKVASVDLTDNYNDLTRSGDAAGIWLSTLHKCSECSGWFLARHLHLLPGSVLVTPGQPVTKGQRLASCDTTGSAHWPHVHTDLRHSPSPTADKAGSFGPTWGVPYDPLAWGILLPPPSHRHRSWSASKSTVRYSDQAPPVKVSSNSCASSDTKTGWG